MMSRACLAAAVLAVASGQRFTAPRDSVSGLFCCPGWTLEADAAGATCKSPSGAKSCELRPSNGCAEETNACWSALLGSNGGSSSGEVSAASGTAAPAGHVTHQSGIFNGMSGWRDIAEAKFLGFANVFNGIPAIIPSFAGRRPFQFSWACEAEAHLTGVQSCDLLFFQYHCPPCEFNEGGMGAQLLSHPGADFKVSSCGAKFTLTPGGYEHPFAVYMAELPANDPEVLVTMPEGARADFFFWANAPKGTICRSSLTEEACNEKAEFCTWDGDSCEPRMCTGRGDSPYYGGSPRCSFCTSHEDEAVFPEVVPEP